MGAMSTQLDGSELLDESPYLAYRSLSVMAVATSIVAFMSLVAFIFPVFLVLPVIGVVLGLCAVRRIRARAQELTGAGLAWGAVMLSATSLAGAGTLHTYVYVTEVPEGHTRISFAQLQPDPDHPQLPVPPSALELDGQPIFIKGYVYPDGQKAGIKQFILVPDMGTCCFGGQPELTDMIEVTLEDPLRIRYARQRRRLAGILRVDTVKKPVSGVDGVYYQLQAYIVK